MRENFPPKTLTPHGIRIFIFFIVITIATLGWFFLYPGDDGSLAQIQRRGLLRVGLDASFPPLETLNADSQIVGLDVDLARAIAADLGVDVQLVNIGFDGLYDALLARRVDLIISGLPYDPRLTQDVAYTHPYFNAGQVLVGRADNPAVASVENLAGRTIAVEWGSQGEMEARWLAPTPLTREKARGNEGFTLQRFDTAAAALAAVQQGQADAAIVDAPSALPLTQTLNPTEPLKIVAYLTDEWYAAAVPIHSRELLTAVNQTLARLEQSGQMAALQAKWFKPE
jgi:polar amino acid transport system substrate-binding protein